MSLFSGLNKPATTTAPPSLFATNTQQNPPQAASSNNTTGQGLGLNTSVNSGAPTNSTQPQAGGLFPNKPPTAGAESQPQSQPAKSGLFSNANGSLGLSTGQSGNQPTAQPGQAVSQPNAQQSQSSQPNPTSNSLGFGGQGGTSGSQQQQKASMPPPVYTTTVEKYVKACQASNQYLFDLLVDPKPSLSIEDFKKILSDKLIRDKISMGLSFYRNKGQSGEQIYRDMSDGKLKWPGGISITQNLQDIIKRNLDALQTFNLFELYFEFNKSLLDKITYPQRQSSANVELEAEIFKLEKTIVNQYYKERINLLECTYQLIVLATSQSVPKYRDSIEKLVNEVIKGKPAFAQNFWNSYVKTSEANFVDTSGSLSDIQDREEWILQNFKEEFYLLKIIYILYYELEECPPEFLYTMLDYFHKQSFIGSFIKHERQITIKSILAQKRDLATMIADLCVLILLNCMNLNAVEVELLLDDEEDQPINPQKNPLQILLKKGKDISQFFAKNIDNRIMGPLIIAWKKLIRWYVQRVKDSNTKAALAALDIIKEDPEDYLSFLVEMKDNLLFKNADRISLYFYRNTIKPWVSLLSQSFDTESILSYERLVDICCECLKEKQNLERFWTIEFRYKTSVAILLFKLLEMFPFREAKLVKLIITLLGDKRHNYVTNVLKLFRYLNHFSCKSSDVRFEDQSSIKPGIGEDKTNYICKKEIQTRLLTIPVDTKATVLFESRKDYKIYLFNIKYNFWNVLYRRWSDLLRRIAEGEKIEFSGADFKLIKLVCKIIIYDTTNVDVLEEHFVFEAANLKIDQTTAIPLLLLNTIHYFHSLPQIPQKIISLIFKALASLQAHPVHSPTLAAIIQLFPRTLTGTSQQTYENSILNTSRSMLGASIIGSRKLDTSVHPILNIFNTFKRMDTSIDRSDRNYEAYTSMLKFAYEIVLTNEFIFDQYPNEKYIKASFSSNMSAINKSIQRGASIIAQAQQENNDLRPESFRELQSYLKSKKSQSLLYSSFIDDLFTLIYKSILDNYDKLVFTPSSIDIKWKIGSYLLKITNVLLQKFLVNLERVNINTDSPNENPLLIHIINYLNNSRISEFILQTLEVVINRDLINNNKHGEGFNPLGIENKYWVTYVLSQNTSTKQAKRLKEMISSCLSCLETIVNLIEIYTENRTIASNNSSLLHQTYASKLSVVDTFEKLLTKKELMHFYVHNDINQSVKVNIILALFSYINFDVNKNLSYTTPLDPQIEKFLLNSTLPRTSLISEEEMGEMEQVIVNLDPVLTKNIIIKPYVKSNQKVNCVSTLALRILTKLAVIWEDQIPQRKPLLYEYITMISHPDPQFASNNIIRTIVREILCIFANYEAQFEDACSLLEMMTVCLHSQKNFVDIFLKNTPNYSLHQQDSFLQFVKNFFASNVEPHKSLLTKLIVFLSEVFKREPRYSSFVQAIRKDSGLIRSIFTAVFKTLTPNYSLAYKMSDYCGLHSQELRALEVKELGFQFEKLMVETLVMQECSNLFAVVTAVRFLMQELISSGGKPKEQGITISLCIKEFFSGFFMMWLERLKQKRVTKLVEDQAFEDFSNELRNPLNRFYSENALEEQGVTNRSIYPDRDVSYISNYSSKTQDQSKGIISISEFKRYKRRRQRDYEEVMDLEKEATSTDVKIKMDYIVLKNIYKILDVNLYGYGKDFLYDTQEIYYAMRNSNYKKDFIYYSVLFLNKQNLMNSLLSLEHKYFESMTILFKFVSTLGLKGQAFSSTFYNYSIIPSDTYVVGLETLFDEKEKVLANSNYKITFPFGFPDFFTKIGSSDALDRRISSSTIFLEKVVRLLWESLKQDVRDFEVNLPSLKALEQKANFLTYAFNALLYLIKISKSLLTAGSEQANRPRSNSKQMDREQEKKQPLLLEETGVGDLIVVIYEEMNEVIWSRVEEVSQEFDVDISPFVILQMAFFECAREAMDFVRLDTDRIKAYAKSLESCISDKVSCLSLIISCFQLLHNLNSVELSEYFVYSQNRLLKYFIAKINAESSSDTDLIFILRFFVELAKDFSGALQLQDENVIWEICSNKKLKESHQTSDYENGRRNPYQIFWCWSLLLIRQMVETLHEESGFMNSAISFIKEFNPRINYILALPSTIIIPTQSDLNRKSTSSIDNSRLTPSLPRFTIAYFEELECITSLLLEYFQYVEQWVSINRSQFELILYNITHHTIKLFKQLPIILDLTISISAFEKVFEQIFSTDKKGSEAPPVQRETNITGSPFKGPGRKSFFGSDLNQKDVPQGSKDAYNPTVFAYKVEISLTNTLVYLLYSIKNGLQYTDLYNYFDELGLVNTDRKKIGVKYELSYWDNFALSLKDIQNYVLINYNKWTVNTGNLEKMSKKYDYLVNSVVSTIQNCGLNTNFESFTLSELKDIARTTMSLVLYNAELHLRMFKEFKGSEHGSAEGHTNDYKKNLKEMIEKYPSSLVNKPPSASTTVGGDGAPTTDVSDIIGILRESIK